MNRMDDFKGVWEMAREQDALMTNQSSIWELELEFWNPDLACWEREYAIVMSKEDGAKAIRAWRDARGLK